MGAATRKLVMRSSLLASAALWAFCALTLIISSTTATETATTSAVQPQPTAAGGGVPAPTEVPAAALPPSTATDTSKKKIPLEGGGAHEEYVPAAEVASALPVPIPDGNPVEGAFANGGLGGNQAFFPGSSGYGTAAGLGGFGPYGYGGGPGPYGYNGPLYFGSAPRRSSTPSGSCAAAAVLLVLPAAMYI